MTWFYWDVGDEWEGTPQFEYLQALRALDWPAPLEADDSGALDELEDGSIVTVTLDLYAPGRSARAGTLRGEYDGELFLDWDVVLSAEAEWLSEAGAPSWTLPPREAAAMTHRWMLEQARREIAVYRYLDGLDTARTECWRLDDSVLLWQWERRGGFPRPATPPGRTEHFVPLEPDSMRVY